LHGRSDSNARHLVLETSALPTELHPYTKINPLPVDNEFIRVIF
jgi:hypothetical protein